MKTKQWMSVAVVTLMVVGAGLPSVCLGQEEKAPQTGIAVARPSIQVAAVKPAAGTTVSIGEGQRLALKGGGYLTVKRGQLTLMSRTGATKIFPRGSKISQDSRGQVSIWGTGGTTIVGTRSFDDPLLRTKPRGFDDPLLKPGTGTVDRQGAYIDPAIPGAVDAKGAYIDPAIPGGTRPD